jgi:hypothetical protein
MCCGVWQAMEFHHINRVGFSEILWVLVGYGFRQRWVKTSLTVSYMFPELRLPRGKYLYHVCMLAILRSPCMHYTYASGGTDPRR